MIDAAVRVVVEHKVITNGKIQMVEYSNRTISYLNVVLYLKFSPMSAAKEVRLKPTLADSVLSTSPRDTRCD